MRILIMGLPGSGKTTLTRRIVEGIKTLRYVNADEIRELYNDWDFSLEGRMRQAVRMKNKSNRGNFICDFVCPTEETRKMLNPDFIIWMNTIKNSRYEDTNQIFEKPNNMDIEITSFDYDLNEIISQINNLISKG